MSETPVKVGYIAPTQTVHPWRATLRTVVAGLLAAATLAPLIILAIGPVEGALYARISGAVIAVAGAITRIFAIPAVNDLLSRIGVGTSPRAELGPVIVDAAPDDADTDELLQFGHRPDGTFGVVDPLTGKTPTED